MIVNTDSLFNGFMQIFLIIPVKKLPPLSSPVSDDQVRVVCFISFLSLIVALYSFDIICNSLLDLFKPLLQQCDQIYETQRLRVSDILLQILSFLVPFFQIYTGKYSDHWEDWVFFNSILHLGGEAVIFYVRQLLVLVRYYPTVFQWLPFLGFYIMIVRKPGPDVSNNLEQDDIKITRNIMNTGYEYWYKHKVRWNINFGITLSYISHQVNFLLVYLKFTPDDTTGELISILFSLLWVYGLSSTMLGYCTNVPFFNSAQDLHVGRNHWS
jgi:hypothetical protein